MVNESALALLTKRTSEITEKNEARQKNFEDSKKSLEAEKRRRDGIGDGRWQNRRAFGSPKTRKSPNWIGSSERAKANLARRQAKARPRKYRLRRQRPCAIKSAGKAHGGPHKRLTPVELRRGLAQGQFQSWMADQIKDALKEGSTRAVIICRCGSLTTFTQADKAEETWAEHVKKTAKPKIERSLKMHLSLFGKDKRDRRRILKQARRMQRQAQSKGLLAQLRCSMNGQIPALLMANRFWVGGAGTWDGVDTTHWSATTGGAGGASAPGINDDVFFDGNSTGTVTLSGAQSVGAATFTGFTGTLVGGFGFSGSLVLSSAMTLTNGGLSWACNASGSVTITSNGKSFANSLTMQGSGTVTLVDAFTETFSLTISSGTFVTGNQTIVANLFSSSVSSVRTLTFGSSSCTFTTTGTSWNITNATNLTITANTSTVTLNGAGAAFTSSSTVSVNGMSVILSGSGTATVSNAQTFANFTRTGTATKGDSVNFSSNPTITGTFTVTGNSTINRIFVFSNVLGSSRTITVNTTVTSTNADWQDITAAGTASWNLSAATGGSGDALGNTGITFTTAATQFWFSGTGNWSDFTKWFLATAGGGGAGRVPLPQDNIRFDAPSFTAGSQIVTADMPRLGKDIDWTGATNSPRMTYTTNPQIFGNITLVSGMTTTGSSGGFLLGGRGSQTITSNNAVFTSGPSMTGFGGTYTFQDAFGGTNSGGLGLISGTINANNQSVTAFSFGSTGSTASRTLTMGSGSWTLLCSTATTVWAVTSTGLTLTISTAVVSCTGAPGSATTVTVTTGSVSMPSFTVNGGANLTVQFADAFTTTGTVTLTQAKLDTNGQTCSWALFSSTNSNVRTLTLGSSAITMVGAFTNQWTMATSTNLTFTPGTSSITFGGAAGSGTTFLSAGSQTFATVIMNGSGNAKIQGTPTFGTFTRTGTAVKTDSFQPASNFTVTGTFTITGNSLTNRILVSSDVLGTPRTITCNGTCSHTNVDWQDITAAGTSAPFMGTSMGDALGNANITFDAPVTRYAVVAGNWSSTATWSNVSGGAGGFSIPLPQDTVILDANSAAGTYTADMPRAGKDISCTGFTRTLTISGTVVFYGNITLVSAMTWTQSGSNLEMDGRGSQTLTTAGKNINTTTGQLILNGFGGTITLQDAYTSAGSVSHRNGTFTANNQTVTAGSYTNNFANTRVLNMGTAAWTISGSGGIAVWTNFATNLTLNVSTATVSFTGTTGTNTITTQSVTMPNCTFNGAGGTWQFADAFTTAGTITLTAGTLDTNSKTVSSQIASLGAGSTRTLTMGSSAWTVTGSSIASWTMSNSAGLTITSNTATVTINGSSPTIGAGTINYNGTSFVITGSGLAVWVSGTTMANLTRTGTSVKTDSLQVQSDITITSQASFNGNSVTNRLLVQSNTLGTLRTITVNGSRAHSNLDLMDITGAGTASTDLSAITGGSGDCGGNSGYTFTPAQTNYYKAAALDNFSTTAKWFLASNGGGGAGRVPLPQDTAIFDANSGNFTYTLDMPRIGTLNATGSTATFNFSSNVSTFGNVTLGTGTSTTNSAGDFILAGRGSKTLTSSGRNWSPRLVMTAFGSTYTLQDSVTSSRGSGGAITITVGTFNTNNQAVSLTAANISGMTMSGGTLTLGSTSWTAAMSTSSNTFWTVTGGLVTSNTASITLTTASTFTRTFGGGGFSYGTLSYTVNGSTGPLVISGANTFTNLTVTSEAGNAKTLTLPSATITTVTGTLSLNGVTSAHMILNSSAPTSQATITAGSGVTINVNFVDIQDSNATGGARFFDHDGNSTSNNTGWLFVTTIGDTVTVNWNVTTKVSDTITYQWNVRSRIGKSDSLVWNIRTFIGKQRSLLWNIRHTVNDQVTFNWQATIAVTAPLSLLWNVRHVLNDELQTIWNNRSRIGKQRSLLWNDRYIIGDQSIFNWRIRSLTPKDSNLRWSLRHILRDDIQIAWNTTTFIGNPIVLRWQDRIIVGDQVGFQWHLVFALGVPIELLWEISRYMSNPSSSTTLERLDFSEVSLED